MVTHESRTLIDGELVRSETGRRFDNINPATEEMLGSTTDGLGKFRHEGDGK